MICGDRVLPTSDHLTLFCTLQSTVNGVYNITIKTSTFMNTVFYCSEFIASKNIDRKINTML